MFPPSPYTNPATKDLTDMERLRYNRTTLQRAVPNATQNSLLLALPAELRNRIYELVLVNPKRIKLDASYPRKSFFRKRKEPEKSTIKEPPLLRICRLFRTEATQMYYSANKFTAAYNSTLLHWLMGLSEVKRSMLVHVRAPPGWDADRGLSTANMLQYLDCLEEVFRVPGISGNVLRLVKVGRNKKKKALSRKEVVERMTEEDWDNYNNTRW